ncbi:MAG: topoisomerase DNA-binding C4 zinc finger domain-containing protein, partial [Firmicutes bacterium]|nr:topoisomerase DNA-binding C4 zinc finger domain-containing protein [Candidatus Colimorpha enterica]
VDYRFTASMEDRLDGIEDGNSTMTDVLSEFYTGFSRELDEAFATVSKDDIELPVEETDIICDKCGARMVIKRGRFGTFAACPNYPACRNTKTIDKDGNPVEKKVEEPEKIGEQCPECGADLVKRKSRFGEFIACLNYPKCRYTREIISPIGVSCPVCGGDVIARTSKKGTQYFVCINNPECKFISWTMPTNEKCPVCGGMLFKKKNSEDLVCGDKNCGYTKKAENND